MIFGKLFGSREQDDEPTATAPTLARRIANAPRQAAGEAASVPRGNSAAAAKLKVERSPEAAGASKNESRGFDPYNSGVFNKSRAWERINRR